MAVFHYRVSAPKPKPRSAADRMWRYRQRRRKAGLRATVSWGSPWLERYADRPTTAVAEWKSLPARPWPEVAAQATALTEQGARLRQSSLLAVLLGPAARRRIDEALRP